MPHSGPGSEPLMEDILVLDHSHPSLGSDQDLVLLGLSHLLLITEEPAMDPLMVGPIPRLSTREVIIQIDK